MNELEKNRIIMWFTSFVEVLHKLLSVLTFLVGVVLEEAAEAWEGNIVTVIVVGQSLVHIAGGKLHVDLGVESCLGLFVKVLSNLAD